MISASGSASSGCRLGGSCSCSVTPLSTTGRSDAAQKQEVKREEKSSIAPASNNPSRRVRRSGSRPSSSGRHRRPGRWPGHVRLTWTCMHQGRAWCFPESCSLRWRRSPVRHMSYRHYKGSDVCRWRRPVPVPTVTSQVTITFVPSRADLVGYGPYVLDGGVESHCTPL